MPRKGENIYRRRDNRWEGRYKVGFDESGKSRYRSIYGKSYQEVKIKLIALRSAPKEAVSSGRLTVKDLFEEWLSAVKLTALLFYSCLILSFDPPVLKLFLLKIKPNL